MSKSNKCKKLSKYFDKHGRVRSRALLKAMIKATEKEGYTACMGTVHADGAVCAVGAIGLLCGGPNHGFSSLNTFGVDSWDIVAGNDSGHRNTKLQRLGDNFRSHFGVAARQ